MLTCVWKMRAKHGWAVPAGFPGDAGMPCKSQVLWAVLVAEPPLHTVPVSRASPQPLLARFSPAPARQLEAFVHGDFSPS